MYFPGEQKPSIFSGASHSSSAHQSSSSQQSSSSSSQSGHRFVVGGNRFGNLHSGGLLGLSQVSKPSLTSLGNFDSLGSVSAVHHSSSSSSSSSASQSHNSASHHSTSYGFGLGNTNNKDKSKPEIGQLQFNREYVGNPEYQQSQGGLLKSIGNNKEDGKEYQQSQFGQLQSPAGSVDQQQQSQFGQIETIGKLPSQNAVGIAGHEGGYQNEGSGTNHHEKAPNLPGGSGRDYGGGDSSWRRRWNSFTSWGANLADKVAGGAREFGGAVAHSATGLWNKAGNTFQGVWSRFKNLLKGFSDSIHKGATYCAHVLQERADDVRSSQFMQKLEDKFEEGNQQVMGFFTVLGDKISKWSDQHANEGIIDDGFTGGDQHDARTQQLQDHFKREDFPDFFQDSQVQGEIEKLVDSGIIQQEEADLLVKKGRP
ncbi:uncharacterized protein LOC108677184 [Hyalella azteca]|uniref:Uncharacterized protein LOC108677184 n=1 Tax=Hyalella azteca TaxID=294128 RepID=A0A8B7P3Z9_HYAAZ|nr:uncharacterized protein LOC108677184 [Hyalella azteca]